MSSIYTSTIIDAPIEKVWPILRNFGGIRSYYSNVIDSSLTGVSTGDQVGSVRTLHLLGNQTVCERLLALSDLDHSLSYTAEVDNAPFRDCVSTMKLSSITDRSATFMEVKVAYVLLIEAAGPELARFLREDVYAKCFEGLKALV